MKRDKSSRNSGMRKMTTAYETIDEASLKLRELARPRWEDTRESSLARVARGVGLTYTQARRIVYRECKRIDAHILDNIRAAYRNLEEQAEMAADLHIARAKAAQGAFHAGTEEMDSGVDRMDRKRADRSR